MRKTSIFDFSVNVYAQNSNIEVLLIYFWAILTLLVFGFRHYQAFSSNDWFTFFIFLSAAIGFGLLALNIIFNKERLLKKYFPGHTDYPLSNGLQGLGMPLFVTAWAFVIFYNVIPVLEAISTRKTIIINSHFILNAFLFIYLMFFSIRRFTKIKFEITPTLSSSSYSSTATFVNFRLWQIFLAIIITIPFYINNISPEGLAFVNAFLISDLLVDLSNGIIIFLKKRKFI